MTTKRKNLQATERSAATAARDRKESVASEPRSRRQVRRRIEITPGYCGGKARIAGTRIPVSALEEYRRLGASTRQLLEMYPALTAADLASAWKYVKSHSTEIEAQIANAEG